MGGDHPNETDNETVNLYHPVCAYLCACECVSCIRDKRYEKEEDRQGGGKMRKGKTRRKRQKAQ